MDIKEIVKDSVRYPFSDWKNFLILGIIVVISNILTSTPQLGATNIVVISLLGIIGFLIAFIIRGYQLKIVKSSLIGLAELPKFDNWINMFKDGIKVFIVSIVYAIPAILLISVVLSFPIALETYMGINFNGFASLFNGATGYVGLIVILYMLIIFPIILMSLAHMANNNSKLSAAFRINTILDKITSIGWKKFIIWYIVTGIVFLILAFVGIIILISLISLMGIITLHIVELVIVSLILVPYLYMYFNRSLALFYMSE